MNDSHLRKPFVAVALLALTALAPSTAAATSTPAAGYEQFTGCPHPGQNAAIVTCFRSIVSEGFLKMGKVEKIPFENPVTLSGGMTKTGKFDYNGFGGMPKVTQTMPGGIVAFTGLEEFIPPSGPDLYASIELAGTPGDQLAEPASLPVKVHMINPVLGTKCYIGSNANPIKLELITGTTNPPSPNTPITGEPGTSTPTGSGITDVTEGIYVDNAFAAPGANGCVLTLFEFIPISIDGLINSHNELPSPAGTNTTIQGFDTEFVEAGLVYP